MALSNSQYDHLMRTYEQKQLDNEFQLRKRYEKAYALIPELEEDCFWTEIRLLFLL